MKIRILLLALAIAATATADVFPLGPAVPVPAPFPLPDNWGPVNPIGGFAPDVNIWRVIPQANFPGVACNGEVGGGCFWQVGWPDLSIAQDGIAVSCPASVAGDITHGAGVVCDAGPIPLAQCELFQLNGNGTMTPITLNQSPVCPTDPSSPSWGMVAFPFIAAPMWILMHPVKASEDESWRDSPLGVACSTATDFAKSAGYQAGSDIFNAGDVEEFCIVEDSYTAVLGSSQCSSAAANAGYGSSQQPGLSAAFYNSCLRAIADDCNGNALRPPCSMAGVVAPPPGQDDAGLVKGRACTWDTTLWSAASYYEQCRGCCLDAGLAGALNSMQVSNCLGVCGRSFPP